ncbi:MAG: TniQ family protein, partial [Candidatus Paceibacterota bacterium]
MGLSCIPIPYEDESLRSVLQRAANLNGWSNARALISAMDVPITIADIHAITLSETHTNKVLEAFKIRHSPTYPIRDWFDQKMTVKMNGLTFDKDLFRLNYVAFCPVCIKNDNRHCYVHDFELMDVCHKHAVNLITHCPSCKNLISWKTDFTRGCVCGFDLFQKFTTSSNASSIYISKVFAEQDQVQLNNLCDMYSALRTISERYTPIDKATLVLLSVNSILSISDFDGALITLQKKSNLHPRMFFSPLLSSKSQFVLKRCQPLLADNQLENPKKNDSKNIDISFFEAQMIMGLSAKLLRDCIRADIIEARKARPSAGWEISLASIASLLLKIDNLRSKITNQATNLLHLLNNPFVETNFVSVLKEILDGKVETMGYQNSSGLESLVIGELPQHFWSAGDVHAKTYTVKQAAEILHCKSHHIQAVIRYDLLKSFKKKGNTNAKLIYESELQSFQQKFIFSSSLSVQTNISSISLTRLLIHNGIKPVIQSGVDACNATVFLRKDVENVDIENLYKIGLAKGINGGKKGNKRTHLSVVTTSQAAFELDISVQKVIALTRMGILKKTLYEQTSGVTRNSLNKLISYCYTDDFIEHKAVLDNLKMTKYQLYRVYLQTSLIKLFDLGFMVLMKKNDFEFVKEHQQQYISSTDGADYLGISRYNFRNLVKSKKIIPVKTLKGSQFSIDLFRRSDVEALRH